MTDDAKRALLEDVMTGGRLPSDPRVQAVARSDAAFRRALSELVETRDALDGAVDRGAFDGDAWDQASAEPGDASAVAAAFAAASGRTLQPNPRTHGLRTLQSSPLWWAAALLVSAMAVVTWRALRVPPTSNVEPVAETPLPDTDERSTALLGHATMPSDAVPQGDVEALDVFDARTDVPWGVIARLEVRTVSSDEVVLSTRLEGTARWAPKSDDLESLQRGMTYRWRIVWRDPLTGEDDILESAPFRWVE